jgi:mannose-6-phosphate isomerase-like protein (cupin superfamily)
MMNLFLFTEGQGVLTLGDQIIEVKTGAVAFVPRGAWIGQHRQRETAHDLSIFASRI